VYGIPGGVLAVRVICVSYVHQIGSLEVAATGEDDLVVDVEFIVAEMKNVI
jgi:hypothetical protein